MSGTTTPKPARSVTVRNVAVIGPGYVGLTLSASPALLGHQVECTDNSLERVAQLAEGYVPITESGLTELVEEMLAAGRLRFGTELALVKTAIERNIPHTQRVVDKVASAMGDVRGRRIALLGLTFKAGTDDLRNSPAMEIAQSLVALGASVQAYDPTVDAGAFYGMEVYSSSYSACRNADALVICTEWPEFTCLIPLLPSMRASSTQGLAPEHPECAPQRWQRENPGDGRRGFPRSSSL
jgi:UDP-glucose 6-dehydrogenase